MIDFNGVPTQDEGEAREMTLDLLRFMQQRCRWCGEKKPGMDLIPELRGWHFLCRECFEDEGIPEGMP